MLPLFNFYNVLVTKKLKTKPKNPEQVFTAISWVVTSVAQISVTISLALWTESKICCISVRLKMLNIHWLSKSLNTADFIPDLIGQFVKLRSSADLQRLPKNKIISKINPKTYNG